MEASARVSLPDVLKEILETKRVEVAAAKAAVPLAEVEARAVAAAPTRGLTEHLRRRPGQQVRVLAEIKRASPSAGAIRAGADPQEIARAYLRGGAAAISVLTDEKYFDGKLEFLARVREVVEIPLLRKDFVIDPYQVVEARAAGADAVLLIVAALSPNQLRELMACAEQHQLDALVEVHDLQEAETAIAANANLIGVNHRDLRTFTIDMSLTSQVAPLVPPDAVLVAESGIKVADDLTLLGAVGAHAVLVGEQLMRAPSPGDALRALRGER